MDFSKVDFRRADPTFVNFVPKTAAEAVDLFNRHRSKGLATALYPECFIHCARKLPDGELDKFHRFIVNPAGDIEEGGEKPTQIDAELERERAQLLEESQIRDIKACTIAEESEELTPDCSQEDEKTAEEDMIIISSAR